MKVLFAPDSFKGSLSAPDAARAMQSGWQRMFPADEGILLPIADGGEGTLDALLQATNGRAIPQTVVGPLGVSVSARWGLLGDGETAVVEMAQAAGLTLIPENARDPLRATTQGVGELLEAALSYTGVRRVVVGLGGSATNDGGAGLLQALGVRLLDANGADLAPGGAALMGLAHVDRSGLRVDPAQVESLIACDVDNPLCGPRGASAIFGPQKGATPDDVKRLDAALSHFAAILGPEQAEMPGAGAAGGTAFALLWLFPRARLRPGIDLVLDAAHFDTHLDGASLVLTGEGRLDAQTLGGKAVAGVARRAKTVNVPVAALVGAIDPDITGEQLARAGIDAALPICPGPVPLSDALSHAAPYLADATERAARWLSLGSLRTESSSSLS